MLLLITVLLLRHDITACTPDVELQDGQNAQAVIEAMKNGKPLPIILEAKCKIKEN